MTVIVAVIVGFLTGRMLWLAIRKSWNRPALIRTNYQGVTLPTAAGIVLSLSLLLIEAGRQILGALGAGDAPGMSGVRAAALVAVLAFTILGLFDDLMGDSSKRGFNGHLQALTQGELTSGMVKALGGGVAALVAAGLIMAGQGESGFGVLVLDAVIIALSANFFNLLDLRPGRSTKAGVFLFVIIAILAKFDTSLVPAAIVVGAAASLILDDLHERLMLGDTGANALGAAVGLALASQLSGSGRIAAAVILIALNVLSEFVSYTKLIDNFGPLKALDSIGRRRPSPLIDVRQPAAAAPSSPSNEPPFPTMAPRPEQSHRTSDSAFPSFPTDSRYGSSQGNVGGAPETDSRADDGRLWPTDPDAPSSRTSANASFDEELDVRDSLFEHDPDDSYEGDESYRGGHRI